MIIVVAMFTNLGVAGNASHVPAGQVLDRLGVHVGLLLRGVDAPHVDHAGDLTQPQVEGSPTDNISQATVLPI